MTQVSRKQYWAIKNAPTKSEKELIKHYELEWILRTRVPTVEEVAKQLKLSQTTVNYYLQRKPVIQALDDRGIPWRQHSQEDLTSTQVATAVTMMNFADTRPSKEKLDQLGVNPSQYLAWLNDPQFRNLLQSVADQNVRNIDPVAKTEFTKLIHKGDWNAIKYYLDTTGAIQESEAPQMATLMPILIEIIQKHVKDSATMVAIANDIKAATQNRTHEVINHDTPPAITASVVEDSELEAAKRMIGYG